MIQYETKQPRNADVYEVFLNQNTNKLSFKDFYGQIHDLAEKTDLDSIIPYKVYIAILSQTDDDAPIPVVLENTLGGDITWARDAEGEYSATLTGAFTVGKTWMMCPANTTIGGSTIVDFLDVDSVYLATANGADTLADNLLLNTSIEIRVYN